MFAVRFRVDRLIAAALALVAQGACQHRASPTERAASQKPSCPAGMVAIRGGEFAMGDSLDAPHDLRHRVRVSPFCLDETEVTVAAFRRFWSASPVPHPGPTVAALYPGGRSLVFDSARWNGNVTEPATRDSDASPNTWTRAPGDRETHPINGVSWYTMQAYCMWRGARLPTEAEWEFAARGIYQQMYPWGNEAPTSARLNAAGDETPGNWGSLPGFGNDGWLATAPVGTFPATRPPGVFFSEERSAGLRDMAGNVAEWVVDAYDDYAERGPVVPVDPITLEGNTRVVRGGAWGSGQSGDSRPLVVRAARRDSTTASALIPHVGGRCAFGGR